MLSWLADNPWTPLVFPIVFAAVASTWLLLRRLVKRSLPTIEKALVIATEHGVILEAKGQIELVCGWKAKDLVGQDISAIVPRAMRKDHLQGMEHYRKTGEGPVIGKTLELKALGPDDTLYPVWLTVFGFEKYSELIYGLLESRH